MTSPSHAKVGFDSRRDNERKRILLAEDDAALAQMLQAALGKAGYDVEWVSDGQTALERLNEVPVPVDVLITDNQMPRLSGLELVRRLRAGNFAGEIVVHCSKLHDTDETEFRGLAVKCIFTKPVQLGELLGALRRLTEKRELTDEELHHLAVGGSGKDWELVHETCLDPGRAAVLGRMLAERSVAGDKAAQAWSHVLAEMHPELSETFPPRKPL